MHQPLFNKLSAVQHEVSLIMREGATTKHRLEHIRAAQKLLHDIEHALQVLDRCEAVRLDATRE